MARSSEDAFVHLKEILTLSSRALELADQADEFLLGAKLSDVLFFTRARLTKIEEQG